MADYYRQGTIRPNLPLTDAQREALDRCADDMPDDEDEFTEADHLLRRWGEMGVDADYAGSGFSIERTQDGTYYLYVEEGLNEGWEYALQDILRGLPEDQYPFITFEAAEFCSEMCPGEFGGSALFITREKIEGTSTSWWLSQRAIEYKQGVGRDNHLERVYEPHEIVDALTVTTVNLLAHTQRLGHVNATRLAELMGLKDGRYVGGAIAGLKRRCKNRGVKMPIEPRGKRGDREWYWVGWAA